MRIQAVLFDMDGTLLDTAKDFYAILQSMRAERGLAALSDEMTFRQYVSGGAQAMVAYAFARSPDNPELKPLRAEFLARYALQHAKFTTPFPGVLELLQRLERAGIRWG